MSQAETEAEALLRSGALYPFRAGLRLADDRLLFVGIKHGAVSLYFENDPSYHFDLEGRWLRCFVEPSHFLRRLDGTTQAINRPRVGKQMLLDRRTLGEAEAAALDESIRTTALELAKRVASGAVAIIPPPDPARVIETDRLRAILDRIARWDADHWIAHCRRFAETYRSLPVLPPDSQDALVLQATVPSEQGGDSIARSPEAFADHCEKVATLLGAGVVPYRHLFLAGPDVLRRPIEEAESYFQIASSCFPIAESPAPSRKSELPVDHPHREGIHCHVGNSDGLPPDSSSWNRFRSLGLRRVSFGVSTGHSGVPEDLMTPAFELPELVLGARSAGVPVSIVIRVGSPTEDDRNDLVRRVQLLGLGKGDHVYLVDDDPSAETVSSLLGDFASLRRGSGVKVLPYSVRKQGF